jgi:predicted nucleotidyltransferase
MLDPETSAKLVALTTALEKAGVPYAVGGAVVLIYCSEPRGTVDLDINIFLDSDTPDAALQAIGRAGVEFDYAKASAQVRRDAQVRLPYLGTPVDLFFVNTEFHAESGRRARRVEFEGVEISLLSCEDLVVYKAMFNRRKDWTDIESLLFMQASRFDAAYARGWLVAMVGEEDERVKEFDIILAEALAAEAEDGGIAPSDE